MNRKSNFGHNECYYLCKDELRIFILRCVRNMFEDCYIWITVFRGPRIWTYSSFIHYALEFTNYVIDCDMIPKEIRIRTTSGLIVAPVRLLYLDLFSFSIVFI